MGCSRTHRRERKDAMKTRKQKMQLASNGPAKSNPLPWWALVAVWALITAAFVGLVLSFGQRAKSQVAPGMRIELQVNQTVAPEYSSDCPPADAFDAPGSCHYLDGGPDPRRTPGEFDPTITVEKLCSEGQTRRCKDNPAVALEYGVDKVIEDHGRKTVVPVDPKKPRGEDDHFIPLCAGGTNGPRNRWQQPAPDWKRKDVVEAAACRGICAFVFEKDENGRVVLDDTGKPKNVLGSPSSPSTFFGLPVSSSTTWPMFLSFSKTNAQIPRHAAASTTSLRFQSGAGCCHRFRGPFVPPAQSGMKWSSSPRGFFDRRAHNPAWPSVRCGQGDRGPRQEDGCPRRSEEAARRG